MRISPLTLRRASHIPCLLALTLLAPISAGAEPNFFARSLSTAYVSDPSTGDIVSPWVPFQYSTGYFGQGQLTASSVNAGGTFDSRTPEAAASSSLLDGTLHAYAWASSAYSDHGYRGFAADIASLGDRFLAGNGNSGAFSWTPGSQGHFSIQLDGYNYNYTADTQLTFVLGLSITSINGSTSAGGNVTGNLTATGEYTDFSYINPANNMPFALAWSRDPSTGSYTITADFAPGGDFDWSVDLTTTAVVSNNDETAYNDYSNTAHISYAGPEGSTTYSESGLFPNTLAGTPSPVPEPASALMALLGSAAVFSARRRKSANAR